MPEKIGTKKLNKQQTYDQKTYKKANQYLSNKKYDKALEQYTFLNKHFQENKPTTSDAQKRHISTFCSLASLNSIAAFKEGENVTEENISNFKKTEEQILVYIHQAESYSTKYKQKFNVHQNRKIISTWQHLRITSWNYGIALMTARTKITAEEIHAETLDSRQKTYEQIEEYFQHYIKYTKNYHTLTPPDKEEDYDAVNLQLATLFDWYSDLYTDKALKNESNESEYLGQLKKALDYNDRAIQLLDKLAAPTENIAQNITTLRIGHIQLMYLVFEKTKKQDLLDNISTYIDKNCNPKIQDNHASVEFIGMQLSVATQKTKKNIVSILKLANNLLSLENKVEEEAKLLLKAHFDLARHQIQLYPAPKKRKHTTQSQEKSPDLLRRSKRHHNESNADEKQTTPSFAADAPRDRSQDSGMQDIQPTSAPNHQKQPLKPTPRRPAPNHHPVTWINLRGILTGQQGRLFQRPTDGSQLHPEFPPESRVSGLPPESRVSWLVSPNAQTGDLLHVDRPSMKFFPRPTDGSPPPKFHPESNVFQLLCQLAQTKPRFFERPTDESQRPLGSPPESNASPLLPDESQRPPELSASPRLQGTSWLLDPQSRNLLSTGDGDHQIARPDSSARR
jgi:hypothetical protein